MEFRRHWSLDVATMFFFFFFLSGGGFGVKSKNNLRGYVAFLSKTIRKGNFIILNY